MGKIKEFFKRKRNMSLKWCFFLYLPICVIIAYIGSFLIGVATNYAQDWYRAKFAYAEISEDHIEIYFDHDGKMRTGYVTNTYFPDKYNTLYNIISNMQAVLIPIWVIVCLGFTGKIFYSRELKEPITVLMDASKKISENQLDFEIYYYKKNEMGQLCSAFNDMRKALFENNRELWHALEERKRLNSAFSHDLRTPLTVLKGYAEFLERYSADGKISNDKLMEVLGKMTGQIVRLEHYTQKMSSVQKIEDITACYEEISVRDFSEQLSRSGELICKGRDFGFTVTTGDHEKFSADPEIVMQVYENIVSNAVRYSKEKICASLTVEEKGFFIEVCDDGEGFSAEGLKKADEPFFRDENNTESGKNHFGLGLYICKVLCEKHGGKLIFGNSAAGGKVTAFFSQS
ncbi:MAG: HAMP domain-containing histidine kinase [Oscillospiraceae bacterium]|nr:HAMP domain-containing histidine kinase [Oscillospiraceae bacterium]